MILITCTTYSFIKIQSGRGFDSNIFSLIPDQLIPVANPIVREQLRQQAERHFIILVKGRDQASGLMLAKKLKKSLSTVNDISLDTVDAQLEASIRTFFKPFRHQLLSVRMRNILTNSSVEEIVLQSLEELYSPIRPYSLYGYDEDPFNLGGQWLQANFTGKQRVSTTEIPSIKDDEGNWYLVSAQLKRSPYDLGLQLRLSSALSLYRQHHPSAELLTSGLIFHAIEGSQIAQKEVSTVGLGSLLAIIVLVVSVFRSIQSLLFMLCVLGCSTVVALSSTWLVFGQVHIVTLAFGSTLLGLAADYCFHFLVKMRALGHAKKTRKILFKGLLVSAVSSILAYLAQMFSPFPGLQQFAIFVSSGLAAACVTVLLLGGALPTTVPNPVPLGVAYNRFFKPLYLKIVHFRCSVLLALLLFVIIAVHTVIQRGANDDVRLLNTSGKQLLSTEKRVRALLGSHSVQRYFLIEGKSREGVLQKAEVLDDVFGRRSEQSSGGMLISSAAVIPSILRQKSDYRLIKEKIYSKRGAAALLCERLGSDCAWLQPPASFRPVTLSEELPPIVKMLYPMEALVKQNTAVIFLKGATEKDKAWANDIQLPGVRYIDQVQNLSVILMGSRQQVSWLLAGFMVCLALAGTILFGSRVIVIIGAVTISCLAALLFSAPMGVTLFHVLALLLVIGIAVDAAVFFITPGLDRNTWSASSLACVTSVVAFGLLSFSGVPLLNQFGKVVFFGLVTAWLVIPIFHHLVTTSHEKNKSKGKVSG
ncbi:MAG: hypothetical protein KBT53_01640 [Porticoccus sp.]|nr:hypothetical protein [Porticoccus sp.]MBQ0807567.1 hypothetical protein [Porticoccus sp.]